MLVLEGQASRAWSGVVLSLHASSPLRPHPPVAPPAPPKLKLLCLHGYLQNAEVFRSRIGSLRKGLKSRVEFVFVDGPFEAQGLPGDEEEVGGGAGGRSWWQWTDSGPAGRPSKAASYTGWDVARTALVAALREHQPDGLLGFSQGATAAALLLADVAGEGGDSGGREAAARLKCAILVAPFLPRDPTVAARVEAGGRAVTTPLLFVGGTADALVPPERTAALSACFPPSLISTFTHGGAHLVPTCSGDFKAALVAFLDAAASASGAPPAPIHRVASSTSASLSASQSAASLASADEAQAQTQAQGQAQGAGQGETQGQAGRQEQGQGGGQAQAVEAATAELERVQVAA
ncbi:hypothetical protein HYH03_004442 [Edaphochlamys debaryana]|uniref:Serine hydrolase domain-containing protein n=1 Tax=Edaphochlamys debaryana TaxID=47281 RepID=A0A835YFA1_9CHLO|nr:hypothetical protein HYH03_004442 [Edaphochlamys debaryana]|eukprot:KAG2497705.1 hypothetical protein HYH03_004442 [Edaphochlamys debaryana]